MSDKQASVRNTAIQDTLNEVRQIAGSLLNRASEEDRPVVERTLAHAGTIHAKILAGQITEEQAKKDWAQVHGTLNDIALKHGLRVQIEVFNFVTRLSARAASLMVDAIFIAI